MISAQGHTPAEGQRLADTTTKCGAARLKQRFCSTKKIEKGDYDPRGVYLGTKILEVIEISSIPLDSQDWFELLEVLRPAPAKGIVFWLHELGRHKHFTRGEDSFAAVSAELARRCELEQLPGGAIALAIDHFKFEDAGEFFPATGRFLAKAREMSDLLGRLKSASEFAARPKPAQIAPKPPKVYTPLDDAMECYQLIRLMGFRQGRANSLIELCQKLNTPSSEWPEGLADSYAGALKYMDDLPRDTQED